MAHERDGRSWLRAIGIGVLVSIITAAVMVTLTAAGLSPFPEPPSLAFAPTVIGRDLPLPVALLFHRSKERRVGAEWCCTLRSRGSPYQQDNTATHGKEIE